jgi:hypothetical protein
MTLNAGKIKYEVIREVNTGDVNDVYICRDKADVSAPFKTIWVVKNREVSKALIAGFSKSYICKECFVLNDYMCFVLPYTEPRPLFRFYIGTCMSKNCSRQQIWLDIVTKCITCKLPEGLLYLILEQNQINIAPDGSIEFGYNIDLTGYKENVTQTQNVTLCAKRILELIYMESIKGTDSAVLLLEKKLKRNKYDEFIQLFKDIKLIMQEDSEESKIKKLKRYVVTKQDVIYRVLSIVCIVLVCIVAVNFVGNIFLKDFSLWKIFTNSLKEIGTESMIG